MVIGGLSQNSYGTLKGKIISISDDSIINDDNAFYRVIVKPNDIKLTKKNKEVVLTNGMIIEARIKYDKGTWMKWFLSRIGIIDR